MIDKKKLQGLNLGNASSDPKMAKPTDPNMTLDVKNTEIEAMLKTYAESKKVDDLNKLVGLIHNARVLVPANVNDKKQPVPVMIKNGKGETFYPIYTSKSQMDKAPKSAGIINMPYIGINQMALRENVKADGVVINPFTDNLVFKKSLIQKIADVEEARKNGVKTRQVKMSPEQYSIFERHQFETVFLPTKFFELKNEFVEKLSETKEEYIDSLFEESYQQKRLYPYLTEDFSVMALSITEALTVIRVDFPLKDMSKGCSTRAYIVWNKEKEQGWYFNIEKGDGESLLIGEIDENHKRTSHGESPAEGAELQLILDLVKEESKAN